LIAERQHEIASDPLKLKQVLSRANENLIQVKKPTEAVLDSEVMNILVHGGVELVRKAAYGGMNYNPDDFVRRLKSRYVEDADLQEQVADNPSLFPWSTLREKRFLTWFRSAPATYHMMGPMSAVPPPKRHAAQRRKRREIVGEGERPDTLEEEDIVDGDHASKETDKNMEHMWTILGRQNRGCCPMIELCLNHDSFAQTVENIFTLSFLVRDGRVSLQDSEQGIIVTKLSNQNKSTQDENEANKERVQFVMSLSMGDWMEWKQIVPPEKTLMPHRQGN